MYFVGCCPNLKHAVAAERQGISEQSHDPGTAGHSRHFGSAIMVVREYRRKCWPILLTNILLLARILMKFKA